MPVLCADIGGTHTRLALCEGNPAELSRLSRFLNAEWDSLEALLAHYLANIPPVQGAHIGVAGPTDGMTAHLTNLAWHIDATLLAQRFQLAQVRLLNDFEAIGHGVQIVEDSGLHTLQSGQPVPRGPRLVLGPGTGLGVAQCHWDGQHYLPWPSEGGHIAFAPANDEQIGLLRYMSARLGRVSVERLLSGPGLSALYQFAREAAGHPQAEPAEPAEVSRRALAGEDAAALKAMDLFTRILGQTAGDLALVAQSRGGVYLAGGIPAKVLSFLTTGPFLDGFRDKGRFSGWMASVPVHIVLDPDVGLKGAAVAALSG